VSGIGWDAQRGFGQALGAFHHALQGTPCFSLSFQEFLMCRGSPGLQILHGFQTLRNRLQGIIHKIRTRGWG